MSIVESSKLQKQHLNALGSRNLDIIASADQIKKLPLPPGTGPVKAAGSQKFCALGIMLRHKGEPNWMTNRITPAPPSRSKTGSTTNGWRVHLSGWELPLNLNVGTHVLQMWDRPSSVLFSSN